MHPLTLEDVLHQRQKARSKADYYLQHLFIRLLRHTLAPEDEDDLTSSLTDTITSLPRSASPDAFHEHEGNDLEMKIVAEKEMTLVGSNHSGRKKSNRSHHGTGDRDLEGGNRGKRSYPFNINTRSLQVNAFICVVNPLLLTVCSLAAQTYCRSPASSAPEAW